MEEPKAYALTTVDNPYDPFTQFDAWYNFDLNRELTHRDELYVNCCAILDRYANTNDSMTEAELNKAIEEAINQIIKFDPLNIYKKVSKSVGETKEIDPADILYMDNMSSKFLK